MAFEAHTFQQYITGMHFYYCRGADIKDAAQRAHMHPTQLYRACTGWHQSGGRDGRVGREYFLKWLEGLRSEAGAPCCGAKVIEGKKKLAPLGDVHGRLVDLRKVEEMAIELERLRAAMAAIGHELEEPEGDTVRAESSRSAARHAARGPSD